MKAILYGIGKRYDNLFSLEERVDMGLIKNEIEIVGFSDNDYRKWGMPLRYEGQQFTVQSINDFPENSFEKIIVITKLNYEGICHDLMKKGYGKDQVLLIDEIFETEPQPINYKNKSFFNKQWEKLRDTDNMNLLLEEKNYKEIAVYGTDEIADYLIKYLTKSPEIEVEYLISPEGKTKTNNSLAVYKPDVKLPPSDLIIVAVLGNYMEIERTICEHNNIEVISILELMYKSLKNMRGLQRYA